MEKKVRWTLVNQRMMIGKKKLKSPEMDGGRTPDSTAKEDGEAWYHFCKKGTYALIYKTGISLEKFQKSRWKKQKNAPNPSWPKLI